MRGKRRGEGRGGGEERGKREWGKGKEKKWGGEKGCFRSL
jgi:hypothetical protein